MGFNTFQTAVPEPGDGACGRYRAELTATARSLPGHSAASTRRILTARGAAAIALPSAFQVCTRELGPTNGGRTFVAAWRICPRHRWKPNSLLQLTICVEMNSNRRPQPQTRRSDTSHWSHREDLLPGAVQILQVRRPGRGGLRVWLVLHLQT